MPRKKINPPSLYAQIKEALRASIISGKLKPQAQLPSESGLMTEYGVSRITVRQALRDLQTEGLIYKHHGKGSFVSQPKADQSLNRLQGFAEAMSGGGAEILNKVLSVNEIPADSNVASRLKLAIGTPVTEIKRVRYLDGVAISIDITYLPLSIGKRVIKADLVRRDIFLIIENDLGIALGNAELGIEASLANEETSKLLGIKRNAPLLRLERLTFSNKKQPIDYEYIFYRGDGFRYRLTIERAAQQS